MYVLLHFVVCWVKILGYGLGCVGLDLFRGENGCFDGVGFYLVSSFEVVC